MFIADLLRQLGEAFYRIPRWARYLAAALALLLVAAVLTGQWWLAIPAAVTIGLLVWLVVEMHRGRDSGGRALMVGLPTLAIALIIAAAVWGASIFWKLGQVAG